MAYNSLTSRTDAAALIPEEVSREIFKAAEEQSVIMQLGRKLPNMSRKQLRLPVASALAEAYFVSGDTGLKQTSEMNWTNKYVNAEELAVIIPVPANVVADVDYDLWGETMGSASTAIAKAFDAAVIHGTNAPDDWPDDLVTGATAASHTVSLAASTDVFDGVMGESGSMSKPEADGYMVTGHIAALTMKAKLRGLRDANGYPIFASNMQGSLAYSLDGSPLVFPKNGALNPSSALLISGDFAQLVWAMRQDMEFKVFTEGVIQDGSGNIVYNLMQQDMVAMRITIRLGWQLPNPVNRVNATEATRYPFGILIP